MAQTFPAERLPAGTPGDNREEIAAGIAAWLDSPAMTALLAAFGHRLPAGASLADRLAEAESFSDVWDRRYGGERHQAVPMTFDPALDELIRAAAPALGLAGRQVPAGTAYDHVLVLGGGVRTMMARASMAAGILRSGVTTSTVAGIGSVRPLVGQEETARELGLRPCPIESIAVDEALRQVFGLGEPTEQRDGPDWSVRRYQNASPSVSVLAAPSTRAGQRANTADGFLGWARLVQPAPRGARLLLVTNDIFVPFQHCDAVRVLGLAYGCLIETVGFDSRANPYAVPARSSEVLQEVRSAVMSMERLHRALA